jgi:hypothetical protein
MDCETSGSPYLNKIKWKCDKAFYQLCQHMEPNYMQYEFDCRLYLLALALKRLPVTPGVEKGRLDD